VSDPGAQLDQVKMVRRAIARQSNNSDHDSTQSDRYAIPDGGGSLRTRQVKDYTNRELLDLIDQSLKQTAKDVREGRIPLDGRALAVAGNQG
jgi:hypothetical protein